MRFEYAITVSALSGGAGLVPPAGERGGGVLQAGDGGLMAMKNGWQSKNVSW